MNSKLKPEKLNRSLVLAALAATTIALVGCVTTTPSPKPTVKMSVLKPSLTPLLETEPTQEKGGVEISIAPASYTIVEREKTSNRTLYERTKRDYEIGTGRVFETPVRIIERTTTSVLGTDPEKVKFQVKVANKMPRVFHGQGMVVQFNVAGKLHAVDPSTYAELVQMIVPPRNEQTVYIYGPPTQEIPGSCTVGLFFYDVVTKTDAAGNVTEKQNFEWYYNYTTQLEEREGTTSTERVEEKIGPPVRVK